MALRGAGLGGMDLAFTAQCRQLIWVSRLDGLQDQAMRPATNHHYYTVLSHPSPVPKTPVKGLQRPFAIGVYFQPVSHPGYYSGCHSR